MNNNIFQSIELLIALLLENNEKICKIDSLKIKTMQRYSAIKAILKTFEKITKQNILI